MGTYTGTGGADTIAPWSLSGGVTAVPAGSRPANGADVINGLGGNDTIFGGGGGDTISGGAGDDWIFDRTYDAVTANAGNVVHGDGGNDSISISVIDTGGANPATNTAWGDDGNDTVRLVFEANGYEYRWVGSGPTGTIRLYGGAGNDTVGVYGSVDTFGLNMAGTKVYLYGGAGNDRLDASSYDPNSDGSPYRGNNPDVLYGGTGDDTYTVFETKDVAIEKAGQGYDTVEANGTDYTLGANIEKLVLTYNVLDFPDTGGSAGTGNEMDNLIVGSNRNETLKGAGGNDTIYGSLGESGYDMDDEDDISGGDGNDRIFGGDGDDHLNGDAGNDSLAGQAGNDTLSGGDGNDSLGGGTGDDHLYGGAGADVLAGRQGSDLLYGVYGNDRFVYEAIGDSLPGEGIRDIIIGFGNVGATKGDVIDLAKIDADTTRAGDQAFTFIGEANLTGPGQLHVVQQGYATLIQGEVDGKDGADFEILVSYITAVAGDWTAEDFIL